MGTNLYNRYHTDRRIQRRVLKRNDFTYHSLLSLIHKYINNHRSVLDIGCGVGAVDIYLAKRGLFVKGIDISKRAIQKANENANNLGVANKTKFLVLNFNSQNLKGKYDLIICSEVLEHLSNDKESVIKIRELLNSKGLVLVSSPSINAPLYKLGLLNHFDKEVGHLRRYSPESFKHLFESVGFKIIEMKKTEGVLRNLLFTTRVGGFFLKIINRLSIGDLVTFFDNLTIPLLGESDIFLVAKK